MGIGKEISLDQIASLLIENYQLNEFSHFTVTWASSSFRLPSYKPSSLTLGCATNSKQTDKGMQQGSLWGYLWGTGMAFLLHMP